MRSTARCIGSAALSALASLLLAARPVAAHGGVTGAQDVLQDYGVLLFLVAVVLIGAGVLTWMMLSPQPEDMPETEVGPEG